MATLYQVAPGYFTTLSKVPLPAVFRICGNPEGLKRTQHYSLCPAVEPANGCVAVVNTEGEVSLFVPDDLQVEIVGLFA